MMIYSVASKQDQVNGIVKHKDCVAIIFKLKRIWHYALKTSFGKIDSYLFLNNGAEQKYVFILIANKYNYLNALTHAQIYIHSHTHAHTHNATLYIKYFPWEIE